MKQLTITLLVALSMAASAVAQSTGTTTLSVTVAAAAQITVSTSNTSLTSSGTVFQPYTGTTTFKPPAPQDASQGFWGRLLQIAPDPRLFHDKPTR